MNRTITFTGRTGKFDTPSFLLTKNEGLSVLFSLPQELRYGKYYVTVAHGNARKQTFALSSDKSVTLSPDWINAGGTENICFSMELRTPTGTAVIKNDYIIEPLIVTAADGNFTVTAQMQDYERRLESLSINLSNEIAELRQALKCETDARLELERRVQSYEDNGIDPASV